MSNPQSLGNMFTRFRLTSLPTPKRPILHRTLTSGRGVHPTTPVSSHLANTINGPDNRKKDLSFAHSAFFAGHRPLFVDEEVDAAKEVDKVRMEKEMSQKSQKKGVKWVGEEEGVARYNDEYAKLFNSFTPYLTPSEHVFYRNVQSSVKPRPPKSNNNNSIAEYLYRPKELPSTVNPPTFKQAPITKEQPIDTTLLAAFFTHSSSTAGLTNDQAVEYYESYLDTLPSQPEDYLSFKTVGRVRRRIYVPPSENKEEMMAISLIKRRRKKMKKHKWKKQRKEVRNSTRYNKERRKKGGVQREKQE